MRPIDPRIQQVGITLDMFLKDDTSTTHFAIVTASKLENIIGGYEASRLATRSFYDHLRAQNRITIIDGLQIFRIVQGSYDKMATVPTEITLRSPERWIRYGDVWIGIIGGPELVSLYNETGDGLFFENIRDFWGLEMLVAEHQQTQKLSIGKLRKQFLRILRSF